jgi:hypothetical protein
VYLNSAEYLIFEQKSEQEGDRHPLAQILAELEKL